MLVIVQLSRTGRSSLYIPIRMWRIAILGRQEEFSSRTSHDDAEDPAWKVLPWSTEPNSWQQCLSLDRFWKLPPETIHRLHRCRFRKRLHQTKEFGRSISSATPQCTLLGSHQFLELCVVRPARFLQPELIETIATTNGSFMLPDEPY